MTTKSLLLLLSAVHIYRAIYAPVMLTPTAAMKLGAYRMASSLTTLPNVTRVRTIWHLGMLLTTRSSANASYEFLVR